SAASSTTLRERRRTWTRRGCRVRWRNASLTACSVLLFLGCGGGRKPVEPALPSALAGRLRLLEPRPRALRALVIREVNAGHVPAAFQEDLLSRAHACAES